MSSDYLMYSASFLYLSCYIPELYANYKNKNANVYNIPEKIIMLTATSLGLSYAIINQNTALIVNYGPMISLDIIALLMRLYYAYLFKEKSEYDISSNKSEEPESFCENI